MSAPDKIWISASFAAGDMVAKEKRRYTPTDDTSYLLSTPPREHADELVEALAFYANEENWRLNGPLDVNSPRFDGESRATALLAKIREASNE